MDILDSTIVKGVAKSLLMVRHGSTINRVSVETALKQYGDNITEISQI